MGPFLVPHLAAEICSWQFRHQHGVGRCNPCALIILSCSRRSTHPPCGSRCTANNLQSAYPPRRVCSEHPRGNSWLSMHTCVRMRVQLRCQMQRTHPCFCLIYHHMHTDIITNAVGLVPEDSLGSELHLQTRCDFRFSPDPSVNSCLCCG